MLQLNNYFKYILVVGSFYFLNSCNTEEPTPNTTVNNNGVSHSIAVTVTHYYSNSEDSLLKDAKVEIYSTNVDRNNATNITFSNLTDKNGECNFNNVNVGDYYLVISKDTLKTALEEIKITENTAKGIVDAILY